MGLIFFIDARIQGKMIKIHENIYFFLSIWLS